MASQNRQLMDAALESDVVPELRKRGFKGSLPHFRRSGVNALEIITFQFDKWGGGFVIELGRLSNDGFITALGKKIPPNKVRTWDLPSTGQHRIRPRPGRGTDAWFRYDSGQQESTPHQVLGQLSAMEVWFQMLNDSGFKPPNEL